MSATPPLPPQDSDQVMRVEVVRSHGGGTAGKILLGIGAGCLLTFVVLCCVIGVGVALLVPVAVEVAEELGEEFEDAIEEFAEEFTSEEPTEVRESAASIAPIRVPERFEPEFSLRIPKPLGEGPLLTFVIFEEESSDGVLVLANLEFLADNPQQIQDELRKWINSRANRHVDDVEMEDMQELELTIGDEPARFFVGRGHEHHGQGDEIRQAVGAFRGAEGRPVGMLVRVDAQQYSEDEFLELVQSIR